mgnify:CR=1 FL=1
MKKIIPQITSLLVVILLLFSQDALSKKKVNNSIQQTTLKLDSKKILIKGESNLNNWESIVRDADAELIMHSLKNTSTIIDTLSIKIKVTDIISGRKKMDKLTHKALKAIEHPYITFFYSLNTLTKWDNQKISGNLTIAGITKKIITRIIFNKEKSTVTLKGVHQLDMTDYGVKPPKLFLGILKTRKIIDIDFTLKFTPNL